jgi:phosphoribosylamine--glycine ligase
MKVLVLGSGAREHALVWKFSKSKRIAGLYAAPGCAGTESLAVNLPLDPCDAGAVLGACAEKGIDLVFIGPEQPLAAGVADAIAAAGIKVFGPGAKAARLESSKSFAREFMTRNGVPCAKSAIFKPGQEGAFKDFVAKSARGAQEFRMVVKKSGLAAGKGVLEAGSPAQALAFGLGILKSDEIVAEEYLVGWEISVFALCDEKSHLTLLPCADHKKAGEDDTGPNTGGMGAICPVPPADHAVMERVEREIVAPTFKGMRAEGLSYRGVLFFGVMVTKSGPKLLEYNVRFGDPETQSLLPLIETDLADLAEAVATGAVEGLRVSYNGKCSVGVVVAAPGYPDDYPKGLAADADLMSGLKDALVFHAGTYRDGQGILRTGGGRCFTAVGVSRDHLGAKSIAYDAAGRLRFEGAWCRPDIGKKFFMEGS